jgi:hypothetical protein
VDTPLDAPIATNHPTTLVVVENTWNKCKRLNIFSPIIKVMDKNNKCIIEMMECMSVTQLEIEKCHNKVQSHINKDHFQYLKARDKKIH